MNYLQTITLFLLLLSSKAFSQNKKFITELSNKVKEVLNDDWFIEVVNDGFNVYFCRSCNENYQKWADETGFIKGYILVEPLVEKDRYEFFKTELADSISYYSTVSMYDGIFDPSQADSIQHHAKKKFYRKNGILKFEIRLESKWSDNKIKEIQTKNNLLKKEILKESLYKSSINMFSDYRFNLPDDQWKTRTTAFDFYFQRLPYTSAFYDYSIFITPEKPYYSSVKPMYVDNSDEHYYENKENFIEAERCQALRIIALTLGIPDFVIVN